MAWTSPTWTATKSGPHTLRRTPPRASRRSRPALGRYSALPIPWSRGRPSSCTTPPSACITSVSSTAPARPCLSPTASRTRAPSRGKRPRRATRSRSLPKTHSVASRPFSPSQRRSWPTSKPPRARSNRRHAPSCPMAASTTPRATTRRSPPPTTTASSSSRTARTSSAGKIWNAWWQACSGRWVTVHASRPSAPTAAAT